MEYVLTNKQVFLKKGVTQKVTFDRSIDQILDNYSFKIDSASNPKIQFTFIADDGTKVNVPTTENVKQFLKDLHYEQNEIWQFVGVELTSDSDAIIFLTVVPEEALSFLNEMGN